MGKAPAPGGIGHAVRTRRKTFRRLRVPAHDIADADDVRIGRLHFEQAKDIGTVEGDAGDIAPRDARRAVEPVQPAAFLQRMRVRPAGLDMHRGDDGLPRGIGAVFGNAVVLQDRREAAIDHLAAGRPRPFQPGMTPERKIPEMMVRVDDRPAVTHRHRRASRPEMSSSARISVPNIIERQPGEALTTVISAVVVTSRIAPGMVPA